MTASSAPNPLSVLTRAPMNEVKSLAESVLEHLGEVHVLQNRTGLVMLPYIDSAQGAPFHLGEVLVAEAHIRLADGVEGYGMVLGRDLELSMAVAVLDAALRAGIQTEPINAFIAAQADQQAAKDADLLRQVNATRVEMETF